MEILNEKYYFFSDVETTGFDPIRNDIVSLCLIVTDREFKRVGMFNQTCRPDFNKFYSKEAEKIHGFSREVLESFQPRRKLLINLLKFLNEFRNPGQFHPYIYHAFKYFDFRFTEWAFRKESLHWSWFKMFDERFTDSTLNMAVSAKYQGNKLNEWADRIGFKLNHHDAQSDTECCIQVYKYLKEKHFG